MVHPRGDRLLERQTWQSLPGNGGIASKASYALASPCLSPIDLESRNETYVLSSRVQIVGSEEELNRIEMATIASLTRPHNHSTRRRMGEPRIRCNQTKPQNRPGLRKPGKVMRKPKKGSNPFSPTRSQFGLQAATRLHEAGIESPVSHTAVNPGLVHTARHTMGAGHARSRWLNRKERDA